MSTPQKKQAVSSDKEKKTPARVKKALKSPRKKSGKILRSLSRSDRVLRTRSQEKSKAEVSNGNPTNVNSDGERKRRKKKKKKNVESDKTDEFSKIRSNLGYQLNRTRYEKSLIAAYSAEGWKGLSLEKLKPEKELQRAKSEIFKRKLKIRDIFKRVDTLCQEGKLPPEAFDSEGEIDSEDIFCAKCGSKDTAADNDIILCDGFCDRGFHQFCLVPPLLLQDIPPDDEGWLCPGCDCKVDCVDMLNDYQGTSISVDDNWEKVFPEAAAAAASGQELDYNLGLSSDDSDDNDYDPDHPGVDDKTHGGDPAASGQELDQIGLPSEDSEDDDFDPDAPDIDEKVKSESSSSDFSSDSEDLNADLDNDSSGDIESPSPDGPKGTPTKQKSKQKGYRTLSLGSELLPSEQAPAEEGLGSISSRRNVGRLDYKKLYDETYGNALSDSDDDDDEDYNGGTDSRTATNIDNIKQVSRETKHTSKRSRQKLNAESADEPSNDHDIKQVSKEAKHTSKRRRQKLNAESADEPSNEQGSSYPSGSTGKRAKSANKRYTKKKQKRLNEAFTENQYPDRTTKEALAQELGLTFAQVNKWFDNTRWHFNHPSPTKATGTKKTSKGSPVPVSKKLSNGHCKGGDIAESCIEVQSEESAKASAATGESLGAPKGDDGVDIVLASPSKTWDASGHPRSKIQENGKQNSTPKQRKRQQDDQTSNQGSNSKKKHGKTPEKPLQMVQSGRKVLRQMKLNFKRV